MRSVFSISKKRTTAASLDEEEEKSALGDETSANPMPEDSKLRRTEVSLVIETIKTGINFGRSFTLRIVSSEVHVGNKQLNDCFSCDEREEVCLYYQEFIDFL